MQITAGANQHTKTGPKTGRKKQAKKARTGKGGKKGGKKHGQKYVGVQYRGQQLPRVFGAAIFDKCLLFQGQVQVTGRMYDDDVDERALCGANKEAPARIDWRLAIMEDEIPFCHFFHSQLTFGLGT
jgi:hypothetical protein